MLLPEPIRTALCLMVRSHIMLVAPRCFRILPLRIELLLNLALDLLESANYLVGNLPIFLVLSSYFVLRFRHLPHGVAVVGSEVVLGASEVVACERVAPPLT